MKLRDLLSTDWNKNMASEDELKIIVPAMNCQAVTDEMLEGATRELARYGGAIADFWKYTATHGRLTIQVRLGQSSFRYEYWSFAFVGRVCAPTGWHMVSPSVRRQDAESFIFSDEGVELDAVELIIRDRPGWP